MRWIRHAGLPVVLGAVLWVGLPAVTGAPGAAGAADSSGALPGPAAVRHQRFVVPVQLDGGALRVVPPPRSASPRLTWPRARQLMRADTTTMGFRAITLGYGVVSVARGAPGVPAIRSLRAWVGFSKAFAVANCPMMAATPGPTSPLPVLPSPGYAAFILGAGDGTPAVTYVARSAPCGRTVLASLSAASSVFSVPWQALGPITDDAVTVRATIPPCGSFAGVTTGGGAGAMTVTMAATVPDLHGHCGPARSLTQVVDFGPSGHPPGAPPPLASPGTQLVHAPVGPLDLLGPG